MTVHLSGITPDNWRIFNSLKVKRGQEKFVASNLTILARAFAFREYNSCVHTIFYGELPIGMLMQRDYKDGGNLVCVLDQFMIAEQYQGKGFGKNAMQLWLSMIKNEEKYDSITLCYKDSDETARNLYLDMGFYHTGEVDEDEIIMEYNLKDKA